MKDETFLAIGTYTGRGSQGIYGMTMDKNGKFRGEVRLLAEQESPSYMCINRSKTVLYAVSEPDRGAGWMRAYRTDKDFLCLSERRSAGGPLCHIMLPVSEDRAIVSSYLDATIQVYPLNRMGEYKELFCLRRHIGGSRRTERQDSAHVHSITATPEGKYVIACDLGTDQLVVYYMDKDSTKLRLEREKTLNLPDGTGPRHMVFSPDGQKAYVVGELSSEVLVLDYEVNRGFTLIQRISSRQGSGENRAAAIRITRDGKYLYVSNRGEDTIMSFRVHRDGKLTQEEAVFVQGHTPRDFILTEDERYLICANQDSDNVVSFERSEMGTLQLRDEYKGIREPVCLLSW